MTEAGSLIQGKAHLADGTPVAEARVFFASAPVPMPDVAQLTDEEGRFELWAPADGAYEIACQADDLTPKRQVVEVVSSENRVEIDFELTPAPG